MTLTKLKVRNFLPDVPSVFGIPADSYELNVSGNVAGKTIQGKANLVNQQSSGIVVKLTKVGELPS